MKCGSLSSNVSTALVAAGVNSKGAKINQELGFFKPDTKKIRKQDGLLLTEVFSYLMVQQSASKESSSQNSAEHLFPSSPLGKLWEWSLGLINLSLGGTGTSG